MMDLKTKKQVLKKTEREFEKQQKYLCSKVKAGEHMFKVAHRYKKGIAKLSNLETKIKKLRKEIKEEENAKQNKC